MMTTTIRDLRTNMKTYFDTLEENKDVLLVPRQGKREAVVIMTLSEYNRIIETEYLWSNYENRAMLDKAMRELDANEIVGFNQQMCSS